MTMATILTIYDRQLLRDYLPTESRFDLANKSHFLIDEPLQDGDRLTQWSLLPHSTLTGARALTNARLSGLAHQQQQRRVPTRSQTKIGGSPP
ncbi:BQ2448_5856 [Microbotryum intermedium]|uniref:BQ2448_5856 protein n=1 Tax=Microbotryum intermedium TaxID=269621 RepID=A0A238EZD3_9BASI|nr:BQ2448_5856 [Microbotryum intermedium]